MKKSYFLTYGAQNTTVDALGHRIADLLSMKVELRDSFYLGEYIHCIGPQADMLIIESAEEGDGTPKYEKTPFNLYSVFVKSSNTKGKNIDKEARNSRIKEVLATIPELVLLKESVFETKN